MKVRPKFSCQKRLPNYSGEVREALETHQCRTVEQINTYSYILPVLKHLYGCILFLAARSVSFNLWNHATSCKQNWLGCTSSHRKGSGWEMVDELHGLCRSSNAAKVIKWECSDGLNMSSEERKTNSTHNFDSKPFGKWSVKDQEGIRN